MSRRGSRKDHLQFCQREGWTPVRGATGKPVSHHPTFELALPDGRILRTRISHPADAPEQYSANLWTFILKDQLDVTEDEFWDCVRDKKLPERGRVAPPARPALSLGMVSQLLANGATREQIAGMDQQSAQAYLAEVWSQPRQ